MSTLKTRITEDMKAAMRAKNAEQLSAIRLLLAALKQKEIDERVELDDSAVVSIIDKLIKQRKDSIQQYSQAGRTDLADKEAYELQVLQAYLPPRMSEEEVTQAVEACVKELGAQGAGDMGKVMAALKQQLAGKADMGSISMTVKRTLSR
jgi:uncharacterized protein YqeY